MPWEDVKDILRPEEGLVHMGVMRVDLDKCDKCGLCIQNCPFRCWTKDEEGYPILKEKYACFSCYNCKVACPNDAVIIVDTYHVDDGFWKTLPHPLPAKMPLEPKDEDGNPTDWNEIEKAVLSRRSVRNFKDKPVPDPIIQRVLEAGRFAPSAGNCQPWKFIVITNKSLIEEIDKVTSNLLSMMYRAYIDDNAVKNLTSMIEGPPRSVAGVDPRVILGGMGSITENEDAVPSLHAPAVILLIADERCIGHPQMNIGICGQNMNLVANSLGIKACWNGFIATGINFHPPFRTKFGIKSPWTCISSLCLGYPKFKQEGIVPREFRPVSWFREGAEEPEIQV